MSKSLLILFTFLFSLSFSYDLAHEFHLSNSELKYKASKSEVQLSIRIFIDDLETALAKRGVSGLKIGTEQESEDSVIHVGDYLSDAIKIIANKDTLESQIIGTELSEDLAALWCYIKYPVAKNCSELKVVNTVLTEIFDDQKNIVSFKTESGSRQFFTYDTADTQNTFSCE